MLRLGGADREGDLSGDGAGEPEPRRLVPAAQMLLVTGIATLALCAWAGAVVLVGFDEPVRDALQGTVICALLAGVLYFLVDVRTAIPDTPSLRVMPAEAVIERRFLSPVWLLIMVPGTVAFAWLGDLWDTGLGLVPGLFAGMAAPRLLGAVLVWRWEQTHGGVVMMRRDASGDADLFVRPRARPETIESA